MRLPPPTIENPALGSVGSETTLWLAVVELADDAALAGRVILLGVRERWSPSNSSDGLEATNTILPLEVEETADLRRGEKALRSSLLERLRNGTLIARGLLPGKIAHEDISRETWQARIAVDWFNNAFTIGEVTVQEVMVRVPETARTEPDAAHSGWRGLDYREDDMIIAAKAADMVLAGKASSPMNAARAFAEELRGKGTPDSKVKRLTPKVAKLIALRKDLSNQTG